MQYRPGTAGPIPLRPSGGQSNRGATSRGFRRPEQFLVVRNPEPFEVPAMKFSAIALALSLGLAGPAVAAPGDPRLIQGALECPPALSGGETFIVMRSDDGRVYYADVMAAQRHVQGALNAGSRITVVGLEGIKPHEIIAVALGGGDAAALSLALAHGSPTTLPAPSPPPSTAPAAVVPPAPTAGSGAVQRVRPEEKPAARKEEEHWVTVALRGSVYGVAGPNLFLKRDDGRMVMVDISKLDPSAASRLRPGSPVTVVAVPVGNKFQATGVLEAETGTNGSTPAKPPR